MYARNLTRLLQAVGLSLLKLLFFKFPLLHLTRIYLYLSSIYSVHLYACWGLGDMTVYFQFLADPGKKFR